MRDGERECQYCRTWFRFEHFQLQEHVPGSDGCCLGCERWIAILEESRARAWTQRILRELEAAKSQTPVDLSDQTAILAELIQGSARARAVRDAKRASG